MGDLRRAHVGPENTSMSGSQQLESGNNCLMECDVSSISSLINRHAIVTVPLGSGQGYIPAYSLLRRAL